MDGGGSKDRKDAKDQKDLLMKGTFGNGTVAEWLPQILMRTGFFPWRVVESS